MVVIIQQFQQEDLDAEDQKKGRATKNEEINDRSSEQTVVCTPLLFQQYINIFALGFYRCC